MVNMDLSKATLTIFTTLKELNSCYSVTLSPAKQAETASFILKKEKKIKTFVK